MLVWKIIFFASCFVVFYNYLGYALIVYFFNKLKRKKSTTAQDDFFPTVSFIVAAFNEEDCIEEKILNSLQQDYPLGKMEFIFITDGSTDRTTSIISAFPSIRLLHSDDRRGKSAALNRAVDA